MEVWNLFVIVVTGLLAIVAASPRPLSQVTSLWIVAGFVLFLVVQIFAFRNYADVFCQIQCMVELNGNDAYSALIARMMPPVRWVYLTYIALGSLVACLLWYIPKRRRCEQKGKDVAVRQPGGTR